MFPLPKVGECGGESRSVFLIGVPPSGFSDALSEAYERLFLSLK